MKIKNNISKNKNKPISPLERNNLPKPKLPMLPVSFQHLVIRPKGALAMPLAIQVGAFIVTVIML